MERPSPMWGYLVVAFGMTLLAVPLASAQTSKIAFHSGGEIYVMDADGRNLTNLTNHPAPDGRPDWSPDGNQLLFHSGRDGGQEIYVMDADGGHPENLTTLGDAFEPLWSPDGERIAFRRAEFLGNIFVIDASGSNLDQLTTTIYPSNYSWSPDGTLIVFDSQASGNFEIYVVATDGTSLVNLTNDPSNDEHAVWSPDGTKIAFMSDRGQGNPSPVYVMNADGSGLFTLTGRAGLLPAWSPDGTQIVYASPDSEESDIFVIDASMIGFGTQLTNNDFFEFNPKWSPDGSQILYSWKTGNSSSHLYVMNADGSDRNDRATGTHATWSPAVFPDESETVPSMNLLGIATLLSILGAVAYRRLTPPR